MITKRLALLPILLLILALLAGCSDSLKPFEYQGLSIDVPTTMTDMGHEGSYAQFTFALSSDSVAIFGTRSTFEAVEADTSTPLESYAKAVIAANGFRSTPVDRAGSDYLYFTHLAETDKGDLRYLDAVYKTDDAFWLIQVVAPVTEFNEDAFLGWLDSVTFD